MPEQLTKHPEVTLQVLRSAGAKCGDGAAREILTQCPAERFCKLPGGEICVYGLADAPRMTQITTSEWRALTQSLSLEPLPVNRSPTEMWAIGATALVVGVLIGLMVSYWRRRYRRSETRG